MTPAGFPHSEISGSKRACRSPKLIAAYHVLRRLPMPRHPSCALSSLTTKSGPYSTPRREPARRPTSLTSRSPPRFLHRPALMRRRLHDGHHAGRFLIFLPLHCAIVKEPPPEGGLSFLQPGPAIMPAERPEETHGGRTWIRTRDLVLIRDAL